MNALPPALYNIKFNTYYQKIISMGNSY